MDIGWVDIPFEEHLKKVETQMCWMDFLLAKELNLGICLVGILFEDRLQKVVAWVLWKDFLRLKEAKKMDYGWVDIPFVEKQRKVRGWIWRVNFLQEKARGIG